MSFQIWYEEKSSFVIRKAIVHEIWSANWGRYDASCDKAYPSLISCPAPVQEEYRGLVPTRVSFVDRFCNRSNVTVPVGRPETPLEEEPFVVCVKALNFTGHANAASLEEWIQLNARLGAGKIVVYVTHLEEIDMDILRRFAERSVVEIRPFEPLASPSCAARSYEEHLWQKRKMEVIAYNDCFYRNVNGAKFVIPLDIDEIIVPKIGNNWYEAFNSHFERERGKWPTALDEYSSFSVRNVYFFARYPGEVVLRNFMLPNGEGNVSDHRKLVTALKRQQNLGPRDSIFQRNVRSSHYSPEGDSTKSFVHVPKTLSVFNHYAFHVLGVASRQYIFPEGVMQLNHYRSFCDPLLIDGCHNFLRHLTVDDSLERFRNQILLDKT